MAYLYVTIEKFVLICEDGGVGTVLVIRSKNGLLVCNN